MSAAGRWRSMFVLGKLSPLAEIDAPYAPLTWFEPGVRTFTACILSVIYHIRMSFGLSSKLNGVPSAAPPNCRKRDFSTNRRVSNQELSLSKYPIKIAGRSTASQLTCSSVGLLLDWRALFTYLDTSIRYLDVAALENILDMNIRYMRTAPLL